MVCYAQLFIYCYVITYFLREDELVKVISSGVINTASTTAMNNILKSVKSKQQPE